LFGGDFFGNDENVNVNVVFAARIMIVVVCGVFGGGILLIDIHGMWM